MEALSGHAQWAAGAGGWVWERGGRGNQTGGAAALIECGPEATSKGHGTEEVGISGQPYIQVGTQERMVRRWRRSRVKRGRRTLQLQREGKLSWPRVGGGPGDRRPGWVRMPHQPLLLVADVPTGSSLAAPGREQEDRPVTGELSSAELRGPPPGQLPAWAHSREEAGTQRVQQGPPRGLCLSGKEGYSGSLMGGRELCMSPAIRPASWPPV